MKIEVHTLCHQEAKLMPYVMRHYWWADVLIYGGNSPDGTEKLAVSLGAKHIWFQTPDDKVNDKAYIDMKNNCWKGSKADWVIVTDFDELVHHRKDIKEKLSKTHATLIRPQKFEMYSESFPTGDGQITDLVPTGIGGSAKFCMFRPSELKEINFTPGCHSCDPKGNVIIDDYAHDVPNHIPVSDDSILCLHYRNLGKEYIRTRQAYTASRLSQLNRKMGWGLFILCPWEETERYFDDNMKYVTKVL